jgi:5,10-methylenetetrahydromethanopterin reductase
MAGDEATVSDRIEELRSAEVDEFAGWPFGGSRETIARSKQLLQQVKTKR